MLYVLVLHVPNILQDGRFYALCTDGEKSSEKVHHSPEVTQAGLELQTHFRLSLEPTPSPAGYVASPLQNALAGMSWDFGSPLTFLMPLIYFTHRSQVPTSRTSIRTKAWAHVLNRMVSNTDVRAVWSSVCSFFLWGETVAVSAPVIVWDDFLVWLEACCGCGVCFLRFVDAHSKR